MLRYIMYCIVAGIGSSILVKLGLTNDRVIGLVYGLLLAILYELLEWKYQSAQTEEVCACGPFNTWTQDGKTCGNCGRKINE